MNVELWGGPRDGEAIATGSDPGLYFVVPVFDQPTYRLPAPVAGYEPLAYRRVDYRRRELINATTHQVKTVFVYPAYNID